MKKYEAPEIKITRFSHENVVTASTASVDLAQQALTNLGAPTGGTVGTTTKTYWNTLIDGATF